MVSFKVYFLVSLMAVGLTLSDASTNDICCPMGWLGYGGHCYRYFTYKKNFNDARNHCLNLDADLVSIHSSIENDIINGLTSGEEVSSVLNKGYELSQKDLGDRPCLNQL